MTIRGVVFDMDGVLVDSEALHARAWREILTGYGVKFRLDWLDDWVGVPDSEFVERLVAEPELRNVTGDELRDRKRRRFRQLVREDLHPFPGVLPGLAMLQPRFRLACATGSSRGEARLCLEVTGLLPFLETLITSDDVQRQKPYPDIYVKATTTLGIAPESCLAVEDSPHGLTAARAAGCCVVGVSELALRAEPRPEHTFPQVAQAIDWILTC